MLYKGLIVKNSLKNTKILKDFRVLKTYMDEDWELVLVETDNTGLKIISDNFNGPNWYADFTDGNVGVVIFQKKIFKMDLKNKSSWVPAIEYGKLIGIPEEQLDFSFEYK